MKKAGTYFDRVIADGEKLPFRGGVFDLVFCAAALHHSSNLPLLLQNIGRVARPGGRLCAINEPVIGLLADEQEVLARDSPDELAVGINETRPNILGYLEALTDNGFAVTQAFPAGAYGEGELNLRQWAQSLGVIRPAEPVRRWWRMPPPVRFYLGNRLRAAGSGLLGKTRPPAFVTDERGRLGYAVLLWVGGELFLLATKKTS
jgi:SAM-dependent methyltransferase